MRLTYFSKPLAILSLGLALATSASAQRGPAKVAVDDPKFEELPSPSIGPGSVNKNHKPKDWLEIEVKFKVTAVKPKPVDDYIDSVEVQWFVIVKGEDRKNYLLEKTIKHINIEVGEDRVTSVYLSPSTLHRLTGKEKAGANDLEAVGGQINYNGQMVGFFNHGRLPQGWWTKEIPSSVVRTQKFPLLNKNETPYKLFWYDRYAEIAPEQK